MNDINGTPVIIPGRFGEAAIQIKMRIYVLVHSNNEILSYIFKLTIM